MLKKERSIILSQNDKSINLESFDRSIANVIGGVNSNFIDWSPLTSTSSVFPTISDLSSNSTMNLSSVIDYSANSTINASFPSSSSKDSSFISNTTNASNLTKSTIQATSKLNNALTSKTNNLINNLNDNGLNIVFDDENIDSKNVKSLLQNTSRLNNFSSILKQLGDKIIDNEISVVNKVNQAVSDASLTPPPNADNNSGDDEIDLKRVRPKRGQYR